LKVSHVCLASLRASIFMVVFVVCLFVQLVPSLPVYSLPSFHFSCRLERHLKCLFHVSISFIVSQSGQSNNNCVHIVLTHSLPTDVPTASSEDESFRSRNNTGKMREGKRQVKNLVISHIFCLRERTAEATERWKSASKLKRSLKSQLIWRIGK